MTQELTRLSEQLRAAREAGTPLLVRGGNTRSFYGEPVEGREALDISGYTGILKYQASELVITARAGTLLSEVEAVLAEQNQMLAFEPPRFGPESTLGGCVASGLSGPRRMAVGKLGDFVLGVRLMDSNGNLLAFGGEVMKNVAGYDVSRLLAGSLGSLGPMVEMSIKVLPRPVCEQTRVFELDEAAALDQLSAWRSQPLPITATAWLDAAGPGHGAGKLLVRLSGTEINLSAARAAIGGEAMDDDEAAVHWDGLRDQTHAFFQQRPLWRIAVPPTAAPLDLGPSLIEWNGGLRWVSTIMPAAELRSRVQAAGGHATLYRYDSNPDAVPIFHPMAPAVERINRRLMEQLDPAGLFNPGRRLPLAQG